MRALPLARPGETLSVLCLGAHSDDIEIGAGGTILGWLAPAGEELHAHWCVLSASGQCGAEAEARPRPSSRRRPGAGSTGIPRRLFSPGRPDQGLVRDLEAGVQPDVVLTHRRSDAHQDHRDICGLTWNLFRDHLILEYEIPKWDGDLDQPNV